MKRIVSAILCLILLCSCGVGNKSVSSVPPTDGASSATVSSEPEKKPIIPEINNYEEMSFKALDIKDYIQITGRSAFSEYGAVMDNAGSGVRFNLDCEGDVSVRMSVQVSGTTHPIRYYTVIVDGERRDRVELTAILAMRGEYELELASGLERGEHSFEIYRATPSVNGEEDLAAIKCNGVPVAPPERAPLFIEFFGDSITAGLVSIKPTNSDTYSPEFCDGVQTYAFYAADKVGAEYSGICRGGQPFTYEYGGLTAKEYYSRLSFKRKLGEYDFSRKADVVVINLGTNGLGDSGLKEHGLTKDDAKAMAIDLLKFIREKNPDAKIVWAYGMIVDFNNEIIRAAINELGAEEAGYYYCAMKKSGSNGHPYIDEHKKSGDELVEFFESKLGIKAVK